MRRRQIVIDENLTGVQTIDLLISKANGARFDSYEEVEKVREFQASVDQLPHVKHTLSIADFLNDPEVAPAKAQLSFENLVARLGLEKYIDEDRRIIRLTLRVSAIGSFRGAELIEGVQKAALEKLGDTFVIREAGGFVRVIEESNRLVATQLKSFGIAIVAILVAIGVVFRSFRFIWLSMIPNVIPLLMTGAIMGVFRIDLSTGTTMIAGVVIGVAVDDTIHYLAEYKKVLQDGDTATALSTTTKSSGVALVSTTLALSLGFWVAILGSFQPTVYFALLTGMTMWFALICDLFVLPACLSVAYPNKNQALTLS